MLMATAEFLDRIGVRLVITNEFFKLATMLEDLDAGKVHSALEPLADENGTPGTPDTNLDWLARADICLAVLAVIIARGGKGQKKAIEFAVKQPSFRQAAETVRKGTTGDLARNIRGWFEVLKKGGCTNDIAQARFDYLRSTIENRILSHLEEDRPRAAKRIVLATAEKILAN